MEHRELFSKNSYVKVENLMDKDMSKIAGQYALFSALNSFEPESLITGQVPGSHGVYADCLMESILLHLKPKIETITGLNLIPSYSYYRMYEPGHILRRHRDRVQCEISATITLAFNYNDTPSDHKWPLKLRDNNGEEKEIRLEVGEGLVYKGVELEHWRDEFIAGKNSVHVQLFLHYLDADGPYKKFKYDERPEIGLKLPLVKKLKGL